MKRKLLMFVAAVATLALFHLAGAQAFNGRAGDHANVGKDEVIDSSLYITGKQIMIAGTVKGDVFCAGQTIEITGTVEGDVLCAGQEVRLSGTVQGDVRLAGQNITFAGKTEDSATLMGQVINIESSADIGRDLTVTSQTTRQAGKVGRDFVGVGDSASIAGSITREVRLFTQTSIVKNSAKVGGDFVYTSNKTAMIETGSQISGKTEHFTPEQKEKPAPPSFLHRVVSPLFGFIVMLISGSLLLLLVPKWFGKATKTMRTRPLASMGLGLGSLLGIPVIAGLAFITVVGIPLGVTVLIAWIFISAFSFVFSAFTIGKLIVDRLEWLERWREFAALVLGILIFAVAVQIPVINFLVIIAALFWGIGGIVWALGSAIKQQRIADKPKKS